MQTIALFATAKYLTWADYGTDLQNSYYGLSPNRVSQPWADLPVPGYGRLICLGVTGEQQQIELPSDRPEDSMGFVVAQIPENLEEVSLLGFVADHQTNLIGETIAIANLPAIDTLIDEMYYLESTYREITEEFGDNDAVQSFDLQALIPLLNRIYANSPEDQWLDQINSVLKPNESEAVLAGVREDNQDLVDLSFAAEELLDLIKSIREA
ncbi:MAG: DUF1822 family protein [Synechococcaceae cyanobacterium RL_1_2]|nr:DUF1822 family protein [Synechococcaceae cyanobacterium RL_1_2]